MPKKEKTKGKRKNSPPVSKSSHLHIFLLFLSGLLLIATYGLYTYQQERILSFSKPIPESSKQTLVSYYPKTISFPALNKSVPIIESQIINGVWQVNPTGASHLHSSSVPGTNGNIIIYGHNLTSIFGRIVALRIGDSIIVTTADSKKYLYRIEHIHIVTPSHIELLLPTKDETLTVYTCTGFLDSKRFVLTAKRQTNTSH